MRRTVGRTKTTCLPSSQKTRKLAREARSGPEDSSPTILGTRQDQNPEPCDAEVRLELGSTIASTNLTPKHEASGQWSISPNSHLIVPHTVEYTGGTDVTEVRTHRGQAGLGPRSLQSSRCVPLPIVDHNSNPGRTQEGSNISSESSVLVEKQRCR